MPDSLNQFESANTDSVEEELQTLLGVTSNSIAPEHPSLQLLLASGQEILPSDVEARVQNHLQQCKLCAALLVDFSTLPEVPMTADQEQRIADTLPKSAPGTIAFPARRKVSPLAVIGSIAAGLVLTAGLFHFLHKPVSGEANNTPAPVIAPQNVSPEVTVAQLEIPLSPLAPPADDVAALQTRGGGSKNPSVELLLPAFTAYNHGDYANAIKRLTPLAAQYPQSDLVSLYLGVSELMDHQDEAAAKTLEHTRKIAPKSDAAVWYSAIAAQQLKTGETKELLNGLCAKPASKYSAESCRIAATIP